MSLIPLALAKFSAVSLTAKTLAVGAVAVTTFGAAGATGLVPVAHLLPGAPATSSSDEPDAVVTDVDAPETVEAEPVEIATAEPEADGVKADSAEQSAVEADEDAAEEQADAAEEQADAAEDAAEEQADVAEDAAEEQAHAAEEQREADEDAADEPAEVEPADDDVDADEGQADVEDSNDVDSDE